MTGPDRVLLIDPDGDCEDIVAKAAARWKFKVDRVRTSREAFHRLNKHIRDLALIVVDLDPDSHGMAIVHAATGCAESPGIIFLTAFEESYAGPISRMHGAKACLAKPVDSEKLSRTLRDVAARQFPSCDRWGHLQAEPPPATRQQRLALRGIAGKLSPSVTPGETA